MTYTIEIVEDDTREYIALGKVSAKTAIAEARKAATKHASKQVYLTFFRASDSQHGYLNSDGHHDITGRAY